MKSSILYVTMILSGLITLFACSTVEPQPKVNIDATVEARVAKELSDTQPTSTPEVIATVAPSAEPTQTPKPTPEPTPTSESTPSSEEILSRASRTMNAIESMRYKVVLGMAMGGLEIPMTYEGEFHAPDNLRQTLSVNMMGLNIEGDLMQVDGVAYEREFMEDDWHESYSFEGVDPREFWTGTESFLAFPITVDPTIEDLDGVEVYKISWDLGQELGNSAGKVLSILDFDDEDMPEDMVLEYWVDANSFHLRKLSIDIKMADFEATEGEATEEEMLAMMLLGGEGIASITMDFNLFDFDQVDQIVAPPAAPPSAAAAPAAAPAPAFEGRGPVEFDIEIGEAVVGEILVGDTNSVNFEAVAGQDIEIAVTTEENSMLDTYLELWGPDVAGGQSVLLAQNDDGPVNTDSFIKFKVLATGSHTVIVRSFDDSSWGDYTLQVQFPPEPIYKDVVFGEDQVSELSSGEILNFTFEASAGELIYMKIWDADLDGHTYVRMKNPSGSTLIEDYIDENKDTVTEMIIDETGIHEIVMSPSGDCSCGLHITKGDPSILILDTPENVSTKNRGGGQRMWTLSGTAGQAIRIAADYSHNKTENLDIYFDHEYFANQLGLTIRDSNGVEIDAVYAYDASTVSMLVNLPITDIYRVEYFVYPYPNLVYSTEENVTQITVTDAIKKMGTIEILPFSAIGAAPSITGILEYEDSIHDWYFDGIAGQQIDLRVDAEESMEFPDSRPDTYVELWGPRSGATVKLAEDDDGGGGTDAYIMAILPETGSYTIKVETGCLGCLGQYRIHLFGTGE